MTDQQKQQLKQMRCDGYSYSKIADALGISENTIKSFCRRNNLGGVGTNISLPPAGSVCRECGTALIQTAGVKKKLFCSDKCRMAWWNAHPEAVHRKAVHAFFCVHCGEQFESYGSRQRKYCSRSCYGKSKVRCHE